jgi:predicted transcriptional regulator
MKLTQAEWQVMNALWKKHPATAREVVDALPPDTGWAYTTVKTMLTRLATKGAVAEEKAANVAHYDPRVSRKAARLAALRAVAQDAFDGALGSLMHFLVEEKTLSPSERRRLAKLLDEAPSAKPSDKGER